MGGEMELREITKKNMEKIMRLKVTPEQRKFVAPNYDSLCEAYVCPSKWPRAIFVGQEAVGFLMLWDRPKKHKYFLERFMIDSRYQGYGFGKLALDLLVAHVRTRPGATELLTSTSEGKGSPQAFYEKYG